MSYNRTPVYLVRNTHRTQQHGGTSFHIFCSQSPSPASALLSMEQQLRAGITPTLPSNLRDRADLARSLPPPSEQRQQQQQQQAAPALLLPQGLAPSLSYPSVVRRSARNPTTVAVTTSSKKRPRGGGGDGGRGGGGSVAGAGGTRGGKQTKRSAAGVDRWVVAEDWSFSRKRGAVKTPAFFKELWMMMAAYGEHFFFFFFCSRSPRGGGGGRHYAVNAAPCLQGVHRCYV